MRAVMVLALALALLSGACSTTGSGGATDVGGGAPTTVPRPPKPPRPNVLVVLTDDQRWDSLPQMPQVDGRADWARFTTAVVHEPQCCPSRATLLTGRYSHSTGVDTLVRGYRMDDTKTVATMLQDAGYRTGLIGKYLNDYPFGRSGYLPPGWDDFQAYEGKVTYGNYTLNENGTLVARGGGPVDYSTDVLTDKATAFIDATPPTTPFFLELSLNAPHTREQALPPVPAPRQGTRCAAPAPSPPPNFDARDTVAEPPWMQAVPPLTEELKRNLPIYQVATCRTLGTVDEDVTKLLAGLERSGRLADTYVIFTSDNGYAFGEHRLDGKGHLYEESIRVPLLVRGPDVVPGSVDRLTSNVDLTPTILDWAGVAAPDGFLDGRSFAPRLRRDPAAVDPDDALLFGCRTGVGTSEVCGGYREDMGTAWGIRTRTHKYVAYPDGAEQLFDLVADPWELANLATDPAAGAVLADLRARLAAQQGPPVDLTGDPASAGE